MKTKNLVIVILSVVIIILGVSLFTGGNQGEKNHRNLSQKEGLKHRSFQRDQQSSKQKINNQNCIADECVVQNNSTTSTEAVPDAVKSAMDKALDDEYKALTTYNLVMDEFGKQRPFSMIARSEQTHIAQLKSLYDKYNLEIPKNPYPGTLTIPDSIEAVCQAAVKGEVNNASLYKEDLLPVVEGKHPDIKRVFERLMNASQKRHLPAFKRCA